MPPRINFTFRCHRDQPDAGTETTKVYAVNDVQFHPVHTTTFTTAGADGTFHFWDRVAHARLKGYSCSSSTLPTTTTTSTTTTAGAAAAATPEFGPVTTTAFNRDGSLFAYAVGYDWSMGYAANTPQYPNQLMLHSVTEADAKPKRR
jgi:mRNA export factor